MWLVGRQHAIGFRLQPESVTSFERTVNISLLCTTMFGHRWESVLLNVGQGSVLPSCRCSVIENKMTCCFTHCKILKPIHRR